VSNSEKSSNSAALDLIEKINQLEDDKREHKVNKEHERNAHMEGKELKKEDKKRKREELREKSLAEVKKKYQSGLSLKAQKSQKDANSEKSKKPSVTFGDTVQVKEYTPHPANTKTRKNTIPRKNSQTGKNTHNGKTGPKPNQGTRQRKKQKTK